MAGGNSRLRPRSLKFPVYDKEKKAATIMNNIVERAQRNILEHLERDVKRFVELGYGRGEIVIAQPQGLSPEKQFVTLAVFLENGMGPNQLRGR